MSERPAPAPPADYTRFCSGIRTLCGIELSHYRPGQMERRLRVFAQRSGAADLDAYLQLLTADPAAREAFLDRMTINVSALFRNPERFDELERTHLPALAAENRGRLRIWSAGCSYGAEPYTLAVIASELAHRGGVGILATDIDATVLARAKEGCFTPADLTNVSPARRDRWFEAEPEGGARAGADLKRLIRFSRLDLLKDRYPERCDLILCRNVVIYFNDDARHRIYERFMQALRPGGILFVGSTERINRSSEIGWERAGSFFYRAPARRRG